MNERTPSRPPPPPALRPAPGPITGPIASRTDGDAGEAVAEGGARDEGGGHAACWFFVGWDAADEGRSTLNLDCITVLHYQY